MRTYILYRSHKVDVFMENSSAKDCLCSMWLCFWILCKFYFFLCPVGNFLTNIFRFKVLTTNNSTLVALSFTSNFNISVFENVLCMIEVIWIFNDEPAFWLIDILSELFPSLMFVSHHILRSKIFSAPVMSSARVAWLAVGDISFPPVKKYTGTKRIKRHG